MVSPRWNPGNLQKHYEKRLQKDDLCWQELLNIKRSMTKEEYEQESYRSYQTSALEYEAEDPRNGQALYRVDKRTVLTIANMNRRIMRTCYHKHYKWRHEPGSASPKLENLIEFIDDLDAALDGYNIKIFRIEPVAENLRQNKVKKCIASKLKPLREKCSRDK